MKLADVHHTDVLVATVGGVGFIKPAPGTWGSLAALPVWWFFLSPLAAEIQLTVIAVTFLIGVWVSHRVCARYGVKDHQAIVIDEVVGMWLALFLLPAHLAVMLLAFGLFRLLDVTKPGPIGWLDRRLPGGLGVMADDLLAGAVVAAVLHVSLAWLPAGYAVG